MVIRILWHKKLPNLSTMLKCVFFLLLQVVYIYGASFPQGEPIITRHELRHFMRSAYFIFGITFGFRILISISFLCVRFFLILMWL